MKGEDRIRKSNLIENQLQELQEETANLRTERQLEKKCNLNQVNFVDNDEGKAEEYTEEYNALGYVMNNPRYNNNSNWRNNNYWNNNANINPRWKNDLSYF